MELSDKEKRTIEHQFDCVCKKVLREERRNIIKKGDREARSLKRAIDKLKGNIESDINNYITWDEYPSNFYLFDLYNYQISIKDDQLSRALDSLSKETRNNIVLAYFLDMSEQEIGDYFQQVRTTTMRQRKQTLSKLKQEMENNDAYKEK